MEKRKLFNSSIRQGLTLFFIVALFGYSGCKNDDQGVNPLDTRLQQLKGTWTLGTVQNDGNDVTDEFSGFQLVLNSEKVFSTQNGGNAWPSSGTYDLVDGNIDRMLRNDGVEVTIDSISTDAMVLSFTQSSTGGRTAGITGSFIFSLIK